MASSRDLRIDFFRGFAMLIVVVDHIEGWSEQSVLNHWTLISLGFSDAAEIFVFLSGYVFAVAYSGHLERNGVGACVRKALTRSLQIYIAYQLAACAVIAIGALLIDWNPPPGDGIRIGQRAWESVMASLTFKFQPYGFPILAFYVLVLPPMAFMLYLCRHAAWLAWSISIAVYLLAQFFPELNCSRFADGQNWYFNPLAWQFLFFAGVFLGSRLHRGASQILRRLLTLGSVAVILLGFLVVKLSPTIKSWQPRLAESLEPLYSFCWEWSEKHTLEPLRLVHFFALVYLTSRILPRDLKFWSGEVARPIVVCGQQSLEVYTAGLVLSFIATFLLSLSAPSALSVVVIELDCCLGLIGFAYFLRSWKRSRSAADSTY